MQVSFPSTDEVKNVKTAKTTDARDAVFGRELTCVFFYVVGLTRKCFLKHGLVLDCDTESS